GRENTYLNGAILGMSRREIDRKFDEIVDFAGVEKYIDTPVKRYSSGMYVRLAFAVAAHLDPEILVVDEVLAVGDAEFQKKCLGKMGDVAKGGRTVLFVSHNMAAVRSLCSRSIVLHCGNIQVNADTNEAIKEYLYFTNQSIEGSGKRYWDGSYAPGTQELRLRWVKLLNVENETAEIFDLHKPIRIEIGYEVLIPIRGLRWIIQIKTQDGIVAFSTTDHQRRGSIQLEPNLYKTSCTIPPNLLNRDSYYVHIHAGIPGVKVLVQGQDWLSLSTTGGDAHGSFYADSKWAGVVAPKIKWSDDEVINASVNLKNNDDLEF
ncbi:MAG: ABC transporter ATP-binding protein, partial [Chloroflexi bacterium]|nr:ABC transporter ATP-binding protein [Chloroflexota bacterium]